MWSMVAGAVVLVLFHKMWPQLVSFPNHLQARGFLSFNERVQVQFRGPIASRVEAKCAELSSL